MTDRYRFELFCWSGVVVTGQVLRDSDMQGGRVNGRE